MRTFLLLCLIVLSSFKSEHLGAIADLLVEKIGNEKLILEVNMNLSNVPEIQNVAISHLDPVSSSFKAKFTLQNGDVMELPGKYLAFLEVPVPSRFIKTGEVIDRSDLFLLKTNLNKLRSNYVLNLDELLGMQASRNLANGALIRNTDITKKTIMRKSDIISLVYKSSNISLKATGVALSSGGIGDSIKVRNERSGAVLCGRIKNSNTVEVENAN